MEVIVLHDLLLFSCKVMSDSCVILWTVAHQAPLFMGFPRQEYCSELLFLSPRNLPDLGIEPTSPKDWQAYTLLLSYQGRPCIL